MLKFILENRSSFVLRQPGSEPKMKVYLSIKCSSLDGAQNDMVRFKEKIMNLIESRLSLILSYHLNKDGSNIFM